MPEVIVELGQKRMHLPKMKLQPMNKLNALMQAMQETLTAEEMDEAMETMRLLQAKQKSALDNQKPVQTIQEIKEDLEATLEAQKRNKS